jgi:VCBS repeat-containing protein
MLIRFGALSRLGVLAIVIGLGAVVACGDTESSSAPAESGGANDAGPPTNDSGDAATEDAGTEDAEMDAEAGAADAAPPPSAVGDVYAGTEDVELAVDAPGVLANDPGAGLKVVPAAAIATAAGGDVTLAADGSFVYHAPQDFSGSDTFEYTLDVSGIDAAVMTATVTLHVAAVNDPPTIGVPANVVLDTDPGAVTRPAWLPGWTRGPVDEASQQVSFSIVAKPGATTLAFSVPPAVDVATGDLSFTVSNGTFGTAGFTLSVTDDGGGADTASADFSITVNSPPTAVADQPAGDEGILCLVIDLVANDSDSDGDALQGRIASVPTNGKIFVFDPLGPDSLGPQLLIGSAASKLCYQPNQRFFHGSDSFTYTAVDGRGGVSAATTVAITINDVD